MKTKSTEACVYRNRAKVAKRRAAVAQSKNEKHLLLKAAQDYRRQSSAARLFVDGVSAATARIS